MMGGLAAAAFASPFMLHGFKSVWHRLNTSAALQIAATLPYAGVVAYQKEVINCSLPFKNDKPPVNTRVRAEAPDGSISNDITVLDDGTRHRVIARADGFMTTVYDHIQTTVTTARPRGVEAEMRATMLNPGSECVANFKGEPGPGNSRKIGEETLLGYKAVKILSEDPAAKRTAWRLPDLGCFEAQIFTEYLDSQNPSRGVVGTSLITTDRLTVGAPPTTFFEPPAGYTERKPSDASVELSTYLLQRAGKTPEEARRLAVERISANALQKQLDQMYAQSRVVQ
jgi:hypothetical protein